MVEFRVLGAGALIRLTEGHRTPVQLQPKRLALLAYLALARERSSVRRETLLALFFPDLGETQARNALNQSVHHLRQRLGNDLVVSSGKDEVGLSQSRLWCDATAFDRAREREDHDAALELYQGELLQGLTVDASAELEFWIETERDRFRSRAASSARNLAAREEQAGNLSGASRWLLRLLEIQPDDEEALRALLRVLEQLGDRAGALRSYDRFRQRLARDLELTPEPETVALIERIGRTAAARHHTATEAAAVSLAVLPFQNLSADPEQTYFCEGITEEITNSLAQVPGLQVAARSSAVAVHRRTDDLGEIGRRLGVKYLLEGSVRKSADRVRITAQLIRLPGGFHVLSQEYDREMQDVFLVQSDVARRVAEQLRGALATDVQRRPASGGRDPDAYDAFLRGRFLLRKRNPADIEKGKVLLEEAVRQDPTFAQAHTALAEAYAVQGAVFQDRMPSPQCIPHAIEVLERGLALDDRQPEAHALLGLLRAVYEWEWQAAERSVQYAIRLAPRSGMAHHTHAALLLYAGRLNEALEEVTTAVRLEPFAVGYRELRGTVLYVQRRYAEARESILETMELEPRLYISRVVLGDSLAETGNLDEALVSYQEAIDLVGRRPCVLCALGCLYARRGMRREAEDILEEMTHPAADWYVRPTFVAKIHARLGNTRKALDYLEQAAAERDLHLPSIHADPRFDPLREEARFAELLRKVGSL